MILDSITKLEIVLAGAVATSQPETHVDYNDYVNGNNQTRPAMYRAASNSTTDATILPAPNVNVNDVREVIYISVYNKDTATVTATIKTDDGTTERIIVKQSLAANETLSWSKFGGWSVT